MPFAETNGERLYYEIHGEGPRLVLIRGLSRSMRFWEPLLPHLAGHFTLLVYDHRGIGRSPIENGKFDVKDMADDLAGLMRATDFGPAHVFGLSLGGMVAQQLTIRHPELVDRLILAGTTAGGRKSRFPRVDTLLKLAIYSAALPVDVSVKMQGPLIMSPAAHKRNPHVAQSWAPPLQLEPLDGKVVFRQALGGAMHSSWRDLHTIGQETLILHGDQDRLIHHKNARVLGRHIRRSTVRILEGLGHDVVAEAPAEVARHVREFLLPARAVA